MLVPFSLRIFVADGDPDGLRVVERSNWIGKALMFPRALLPRVKGRDELQRDPSVWWPLTFATLTLFTLSLAFSLFGDALRDALDPKLRT